MQDSNYKLQSKESLIDMKQIHLKDANLDQEAYSSMEANVKEEYDVECNKMSEEELALLLTDLDKVKEEIPEELTQQQSIETSEDREANTASKTSTGNVKEEPDSKCGPRLSQYRVALLTDLTINLKDESDVGNQTVTMTSGKDSSCADPSVDHAMQQIINGCFVKLYKLIPLQCSKCHTFFQKRAHLEAHDCHNGVKKKRVREKRVATSKKKVTATTRDKTAKLRVYTCDVCNDEFNSKSSLNRHKAKAINHSLKHSVTCDICQSDFITKRRLEVHILRHMNMAAQNLLKCDLCGRKFNNSSKLTIHRHICATWFFCNVCPKRFRDQSDLSDHKKIHEGLTKFTCDLCQKEHDSFRLFLSHKRWHKKKCYFCDVCQKKFFQKQHIIEHVGTHTDEGRLVCGLCEMIFFDKLMFLEHKIMHSREPHKCDVCGIVFDKKSLLTKHKRTHGEEKPYKCDICQRKFRFQSYLSTHKRFHTQKKPFMCDICKRLYASEAKLRKHKKKLHFSAKPFKCEFCECAYLQKSDLTVHRRTHTGEKPFVCNMCGKAFTHRSTLNEHKRNVHLERPIKT